LADAASADPTRLIGNRVDPLGKGGSTNRLLTVAIVAVAAGCGGSHAKTVTVSAGVSQPTTTQASAPTTTTAPDPADQVSEYIDAVTPSSPSRAP
jgi:hypothetical protein